MTASDLSACYRRNSASAHANLCQCCVYYSLQTTTFFPETNIVKREMRPSGTVGRNNTSKWTYTILQCIPYLIQMPLGICKSCPGCTALLPYLLLAACLWSPLVALLTLATLFMLTLQWQCLVTGSAIYMDCRTCLLPWPCSLSRVSCSIYWTSAII